MSDPVDIQKPVVVRTMSKRTVRRISAFFGLLLVVFAVLFATRRPIRMSMKTAVSLLTSKPAPSTSGIIHYGNKVLLASCSWHFVIVNFFTSLCVPYQNEELGLAKFAQEHQKAADATVSGVDFNDATSSASGFPHRYDATYQAVPDSAGQIALLYGLTLRSQSYLEVPKGVILNEIVEPINQSPLD